MRPNIVLGMVVLSLSLISVALAEEPSPYRLTVTIAQMPPSSPLLAVAGCTMNCYSGEVECKSARARNFQLAEASDGKTYELQCMPAAGRGGCPVPLGTYPARRVKDELHLLVTREDQPGQEQIFSILSTRKTQARGEPERRCGEAVASRQ
jgi:hypothetical protein